MTGLKQGVTFPLKIRFLLLTMRHAYFLLNKNQSMFRLTRICSKNAVWEFCLVAKN